MLAAAGWASARQLRPVAPRPSSGGVHPAAYLAADANASSAPDPLATRSQPLSLQAIRRAHHPRSLSTLQSPDRTRDLCRSIARAAPADRSAGHKLPEYLKAAALPGALSLRPMRASPGRARQTCCAAAADRARRTFPDSSQTIARACRMRTVRLVRRGHELQKIESSTRAASP